MVLSCNRRFAATTGAIILSGAPLAAGFGNRIHITRREHLAHQVRPAMNQHSQPPVGSDTQAEKDKQQRAQHCVEVLNKYTLVRSKQLTSKELLKVWAAEDEMAQAKEQYHGSGEHPTPTQETQDAAPFLTKYGVLMTAVPAEDQETVGPLCASDAVLTEMQKVRSGFFLCGIMILYKTGATTSLLIQPRNLIFPQAGAAAGVVPSIVGTVAMGFVLLLF